MTGAIIFFLIFTYAFVARAGCGCEPVVDTCGIIDGGAGVPAAGNVTIPDLLCDDCSDALPDHCGVCGGCQLPFVTCNVTASRSGGGLVSGNRLGSIASIAIDHVACGQYHSADPTLSPHTPSGVWTFMQEPPPAPVCNWSEYKLVEPYAKAIGHSSDASDNLLLIGDMKADPKTAHLYGRTDPFPPFKWFFDLADPCGGNQYGWDVAVDEKSGFMFVSDPKAYFNGTVWVYRVISPDLAQNITYAGGSKGERFGHAIDAQAGWLVVGRPNCKEGPEDNSGCLNFYRFNGTKWVLTKVILGSPDPYENEKLGWRVSTDGNWTAVGAMGGGVVQMYKRNGNNWVWKQTLEEPGVFDGNRFGYALQVRGNITVVGDERYYVSPIARGAVFTYRLQGGKWQLWSSYTDSTGSFDTHFGAAVDVSDKYILIGIPGAVPRGSCLLVERNVSQCFGCDDVYNSCKVKDACGVCDGDNSTCPGCDGVPGSGLVNDSCGVCGGHNDTCIIVDPQVYDVPCNFVPGAPLNSTSFVLGTLFNDSLPRNFTLWNPPSVGKFYFNTSSGNFTFQPPFLFHGPILLNVTACYVNKSAVVPPDCNRGVATQLFLPCKAYVPPGPAIVCNNTNVTINVLPCTDCNGINGTGLLKDACGVCGGDNSTCSGCDGVPNSGKVLDYCGSCGGTNTTCLVLFPPPFLPGPCNPYKIRLWWEPHANHVVWVIVQAPTYGTASVNQNLGILNYYPPSDMTGVGPIDVVKLQAKDAFNHIKYITINIPMSFFVPDACGLCAGNGSTCMGCDGVPNSGLKLDVCGVCGGDGSTCNALEKKCDWMCYFLTFVFALLSVMVILILIFLLRFLRWCSRIGFAKDRMQAIIPERPDYYVNGTHHVEYAPQKDMAQPLPRAKDWTPPNPWNPDLTRYYG